MSLARIWIINQYSSTPDTGLGGRHHYLARELATLGHTVTLIAAQWHHLLHDSQDLPPQSEHLDGYRFFRVPVPRYTHAHAKRRILNWMTFGYKLPQLPKQLGETPEVILYSSPSLLGFLGALRLARKNKARLVFEVRDIWPLTLVEVGEKSPKHLIIRLMKWVERYAYQTSDAVISNLPNAIEHMVAQGMPEEKFTWIPNGVSLDELAHPELLTADITDQLPNDKFIVGYTGTIGTANALATLVQTADILRHSKDLAFVIVGKGRAEAELRADIKTRGLTNIHILPPVRKRQVQSMLAKFDVCVICWSKHPLYRFGTSANKVPEYLFSKRPVLNAFSGFGDFVTYYNAGQRVEAETPDDLSQAILDMKALSPEERNEMGKRGHNAVLANLEYGALARKLEKILLPDLMEK